MGSKVVKLDAAGTEVFFNAVQLEEIGEFERTLVSASLMDLPLE